MAEARGWTAGLRDPYRGSINFLPTSLGRSPGPPCCLMLGVAWGYLQLCSQSIPWPGVPPHSYLGPWHCAWHSKPSRIGCKSLLEAHLLLCPFLHPVLQASKIIPYSLQSPMLTHSGPLLISAVFQDSSSLLPPCARIHSVSCLIRMGMSPRHKIMPHPLPAQCYLFLL